MKRIFLVGCPRSGTSIVQRCLASHPEVLSVPESRLFRTVVAAHALPRMLGIASRRAAFRLEPIYQQLKLPGTPRRHLWMSAYFQDFWKSMDQKAREAGKTCWLEKTPDHVHFLPQIFRSLPDALVVHLIRPGPQTIASLYEVTRKFPKPWGGPWTVQVCIEQWCRDVQASLQYAGHPGHVFLRFEKFLQATEVELHRITDALGLKYVADMLQGEASAEDIVLPCEPWKTGVGEAVQVPDEHKFETLLSRDEQAEVLSAVRELTARIDRLS